MAAPTMKTATPQVIGLLRVSTDAQDVARQTTDLKKIEKKHGVHVTRIVRLQGVSGTATLDNEQIQVILREVQTPGCDGLACSSLDRLFRPAKRLGQFAILDPFMESDKSIWTIREGHIDVNSDEGYDKCIQAGGRAGAEWRELRRKTIDGKREVIEDGKLPWGDCAFGWKIIGRKQTGVMREGIAVLDDYAVPIIRDMFHWRDAGERTYSIAARLNREGRINNKGHHGKPPLPWSRTTVLQTLQNPAYTGVKHCNGQYEGLTVEYPPIISEELFRSVQSKMELSGKRWVGRPSKLWLLRSFLWCAKCNHRCVTVRNGRKRHGYRCGNVTNKPPIERLCFASQVLVPSIEAVVWAAIWGMLQQPAMLMEMGRAYYANKAKPHADAIADIEAQIERLEQVDRNLSRSMKYAANDAEFDSLRAELLETRSNVATLKHQLVQAGKVVELPAMAALEASVRRITNRKAEPETYDERRPILEGLIDLRLVWDDRTREVTISGAVPVSTEAMEDSGSGVQNCHRRVQPTSNSVPSIPFELKRFVA